MPLQKLTLKPGVNRENTRYTNEGGWYESEKVRFRQGTPEKIGGWQRISANTFLGYCRSLWNWVTLAGDNLLGVGTSSKFYVENNGNYYDITPIRSESTLTNPFTTAASTLSTTITSSSTSFTVASGTNFPPSGVVLMGTEQIAYTTKATNTFTGLTRGYNSTTAASHTAGIAVNSYGVTVTDALGGFVTGDSVTFYGGSAVGGLTVLGEYQLTVISSSTYSIIDNTAATSSATGGGTVYAVYQVTTSLTPYTTSVGWGAGTWGSGTWGIGTPAATAATGTFIWNQNNWGENLVYGPRGSPLYYWDANIGYTSTTITFANTTPTPCLVSCSLNLLENTPITFSTTGALPTGLIPGIIYYVVNAGTTEFNIAASAGGTPIVVSGLGSGTQTVSPRGVPISALAGADIAVPLAQNTFTISDANRFLIVFGTNNYFERTIDPMLIRWSDQESLTTWYPAVTNQAGSVRLSHGSKIITTLQSRQEILVWTDSTLYTLQYLGPPYVWGSQLLADNVSIAGPNAAAIASGVTYWMGVDKFYKYDGRVQTLRCDLRQYIYENINLDTNQAAQIFASTNEGFNEIWFFYCSAASTEIDKYVIYNYLEDNWYYGSMGRTAWLDTGLRNYPLAATYSNNIVQHEYGVDDNTTGTPTAITASITSSQYDIGDGHNFAFVYRMIPDLTFRGSTAGTTPQVTMYLQGLNNSGSGVTQSGNADVVNTGVAPSVINVDQYTGQVYIRVRGRQMQMQITSNTLGTQWQLGAPRIDLRPDGRR